MKGTEELEHQIAERFHGYGRLAPDSDGWEGIHDRIEHRGRARHRRRAAATCLVVAGMVGSLVVLTGDDGARLSTTSPAAPDGPAVSLPADGGLPRLVLDLPGFVLSHASSDEAGLPFPDLGPLLVFGAPGDGLLGLGPVLFARLVPAGASYGVGDGPEVLEVDVAGRPGRIFSTGDVTVSLGWPRTDGSIVHVLGVGMSDDDVLASGQAIEYALAAGLPLSPTMPGGIELRRSTPPDTSPSRHAEVDYQSGSRSVGLRLVSGGQYRLDDLVLDRLASSAGWRAATVAGTPAVLSTYPPVGDRAGVVSLTWAVGDGVVAELTADGLSDAEIQAAAASIHQVDEVAWNEVRAAADALQAVSVPGQAEVDALHESVTAEMCQARNGWLKARDAGDRAVEAASLANVADLREKGQAADLGDTGDILVVMERLLDAMAAGDDALVSSIPEGGACS